MKNIKINTKPKSPKTRLQKLIKKYESNQHFIHQITNLSKDDYSLAVFETGIMFLEQLYPRSTMFESHYKKYAYSQSFWKWWKVEWKKWENDLVNYLALSSLKLSQKIWLDEMQQLAHDRHTEISFTENYLKKLQYVL